MTKSQVAFSRLESLPAIPRSWKILAGVVRSTVKYLLRTEVHTFAFSVAANALLSFFPFVLLLMTVIRRVLHSPAMYKVVVQLLRDFLPAGQDFLIRNLNALVEARHRAQVASLLILLVTSTGIFMPLEVALNRIWRFPNNRSYFGNQLIALGLAFSCGVLASALDCLDGRKHRLSGSVVARSRAVCRPAGRVSDDENVRHLRQHRDFLSHLLAAAQRQSAGPSRVTVSGHHGLCLRL